MNKIIIFSLVILLICLSACSSDKDSDTTTYITEKEITTVNISDDTDSSNSENSTSELKESTTDSDSSEESTEKESESEIITNTVTKSDSTKATSKITVSTKATTKKTTTKKSVSEPTYINGILVVNKTYGLPSTYAPGVNQTALNAYYEMKKDAAEDGISLYIVSDYRPYSSQERIYNNYVSQDGKAEADRYSARPGHSEHQTGLAFDLNSLSQSFEYSDEGKWLADNCSKYGFIIRYPKGKESITGYMYEPWHIRYLGKETAQKITDSGLTLEEYLGITSRYSD